MQAADRDRETVEQPADWRRAAWGLFIASIGVGLILSTAGVGLSLAGSRFGAGMLLLGLAAGWMDSVFHREQRRVRARVRTWINGDDSRA